MGDALVVSRGDAEVAENGSHGRVIRAGAPLLSIHNPPKWIFEVRIQPASRQDLSRSSALSASPRDMQLQWQLVLQWQRSGVASS